MISRMIFHSADPLHGLKKNTSDNFELVRSMREPVLYEEHNRKQKK